MIVVTITTTVEFTSSSRVGQVTFYSSFIASLARSKSCSLVQQT